MPLSSSTVKYEVPDRQIKHRNGTTTALRHFDFRAPSAFVGRDKELRRLKAALAQAAYGEGSAIFLTGQPGIGKTRLAKEALSAAKDSGFVTIQGRAYPVEAGLAYATFLDAFGPLVCSLNSARLVDLVRGLPVLGRLFGSIQIPPSEPLGDPALEKTCLFDAMSRLLQGLALDAPVMLFMDDMQWADPASIELLHYLARGLASQRVLLLVANAVDSSNTSRSLRAVIGSLQCNELAEEIVLQRLSRDAVGDLVRVILGDEPPDDLLTLLEARAGGAPLFLKAFVSSLIDSGDLKRNGHGWVLGQHGADTLPPSVRRLILNRLDRLPAADRRVVDFMAVMGDAAPHSILRAACAMDEESLLRSLRRLLAAGVIAERMDASDVAYNITYPLIREVAYAELPEAAKRHAHLSVIEALESLSGKRPEDLSRLTRHYRGAGPDADRSRALAALHATRQHRLGGFPVSERELEIALLVARGLTTAEIAKRLTISPHTVSTHLHRIYTRVGVSSRTALARCVIEAGLSS